MNSRRLSAYIQIMRPVNGLMQAVAVFIGHLVLDKTFIHFSSLVLGMITAVTLTGASMAINDFWDREVDAINVPSRPIPSGRIRPLHAIIFAVGLSLIGLIAAYMTNGACIGIALVSYGIALMYNWKGKEMGFLGNLMVSACVAIPFIYGGFIPKGIATTLVELGGIVAFSSMAFLATTGREITKGIADIEGDQLRNTRTIAIQYGARVAAIVSVVFYLFPVLVSLLVWWVGIVSAYYLPVIVLADIGFLGSALSLTKDFSATNAKRVKNHILLWMFIGLIAFIIGGI